MHRFGGTGRLSGRRSDRRNTSGVSEARRLGRPGRLTTRAFTTRDYAPRRFVMLGRFSLTHPSGETQMEGTDRALWSSATPC